jgi:hypothetical protein
MKNKAGVLSFALMAIVATSFAQASEMNIKSLMLDVCTRQTTPLDYNKFYVEYENGSQTVNAFIPLRNNIVSVSPTGEVTILQPGSSQPVSLGMAVRTWKNTCQGQGFQFDVTRLGANAQFDIRSSLQYPCTDTQGVFPHPALCENETVELNLRSEGAQIDFQCTQKIQTSAGSGHQGARVGGDCTPF